METSLKTGSAQIFSCCPQNLSSPNFGGAAAPLAPPPGPYAYDHGDTSSRLLERRIWLVCIGALLLAVM